MSKRLSVVLSQAQSQDPTKRKLEEDVVAALLMEPGIDVILVPHLYDLKSDGTGILALTSIGNNMVVLAWLYERATRWVLDRHGIRGREGVALLKDESDSEEDEDDPENEAGEAEVKERVIDTRPIPNRKIYCLDLRVRKHATEFVQEIKRIHRENAESLVSLTLGGPALGPISSPSPSALARFQTPTNDTALPIPSSNVLHGDQPSLGSDGASSEVAPAALIKLNEDADRRWYPVIDYSRCTNCMECIDFCLFGVYGVDKVETILVEQPDNCRKGCPACSRVCPENAIIFPQHKAPNIAGANFVEAGGLKIDLSRLFGAPETNESAEAVAIRERDEQLMLAGRAAVGETVGVRKKETTANDGPKDHLDRLIDQLEELDI